MGNYKINGIKVEVGQKWLDSEGDINEVIRLENPLDGGHPIVTSGLHDLEFTWTEDGLCYDDEPDDVRLVTLILESHQARAVKEKAELDIKAQKLSDFIGNSATFDTLRSAERELLREQCEIMWQYSEILGKRIALFYNKIGKVKS